MLALLANRIIEMNQNHSSIQILYSPVEEMVYEISQCTIKCCIHRHRIERPLTKVPQAAMGTEAWRSAISWAPGTFHKGTNFLSEP